MNRKQVLVIFGTRPEAIKMAPVVKKLKAAKEHFDVTVCVTGQHREILDQMLSLFEIRPDTDLDLMENNQTLSGLTAVTVTKLVDVFGSLKPDVVLVQGDTTTAMAAGLAAFYQKVPVGHVEAGLRTDNRYDPFPEEINRRLLSVLSTYHFAPTKTSVETLLRENVPAENVFLTGNTVIDALFMLITRKNRPSPRIPLNGRCIMVTAHRRENFGEPINNICDALTGIAERNPDVQIIYPVHPNPNIRGPVYRKLENVKGVHLLPPLEYEEFVHLMKDSYIILTDSGGVQEEAPSLGKPVLVMRETTERPDAVDGGVARLVGTKPDNIISSVENLLNNDEEYQKMARAINPFGDGKAADRIVDILAERL